MLRAPKNIQENVRFRRELMAACSSSTGESLRKDVIAKCATDPIFFFDFACWTYAVKDSADVPDVPFILYPYQEDVVRKMDEAFGKHSLLIEKSRDLGLSWVVTTMFLWRWLFRQRQSFLMASRKESLVDERGNPGCLFWKLRFGLAMLPHWLRPPSELIEDNCMHLGNLVNGSSIDGESTQGNVARGDRRTAILLDEFAAVDCGDEVLNSTQSATNCRIFVSTPQGSSGAFFETRQKLLDTTPERVLRLHWSSHPIKNRGLYIGHRDGRLEVLDKTRKCPADYNFRYDGKLRSIWYDSQCDEAVSDVAIAAELDIDYTNSVGGPLIRPELLQSIVVKCKSPLFVGELAFDEFGCNPKFTDSKLTGSTSGNLRLWTPLDMKGQPPEGDYVVSADVAFGSGSKNSSSSVLCVGDKKTKMKVARFKSNAIYPQDLARYAVALCKWFHGAVLIQENNGPGGAFRKAAYQDFRYRNMWRGDSSDPLKTPTEVSYGWQSNKEKKKLLLLEMAHALIDGRFYDPSEEGVREISEYTHDSTGAIVHQKNRTAKAGAEADHGDEVISTGLLWKCMDDGGRRERDEERVTNFPIGSFGHRRSQWLRKQRETKYY